MKKEYDLSKMKKRKNPYASRLKKQVTIRMGTDIISYDFASNRKDGVSDFYGPMTMISVAGGDLAIDWNCRDCASAHLFGAVGEFSAKLAIF